MPGHVELFAGHCLPVAGFDPVPVPDCTPWPVAVVSSLLCLLAVIAVSRRRLFGLVIRSLYSQRFCSKLEHEGKVMSEPVSVVIALFSILTFACGIEFFMGHFRLAAVARLHYMVLYGAIVAVLMLLLLLKYAFNHLHAYLFGIKGGADAVALQRLVLSSNLAVVLLPVLTVAQFSGCFNAIYLFVPFFAVAFLNYARKLIMVNRKAISLFQYFIYFCTLEILPYLLLVKWIVMN